VIVLERVIDPVSGEEVDAVVMERLDGPTLGARLRGPAFTVTEASAIGTALIAGLRHIHAQGMTHGDLHEDNVMLTTKAPKVIDLLYRDSLALRSTATRETLLRRDIMNLRLILNDILLNSECDAADAADFNASLGGAPSLDDIDTAFSRRADPTRRLDVAKRNSG
jgi:serine/threonine protein kinase